MAMDIGQTGEKQVPMSKNVAIFSFLAAILVALLEHMRKYIFLVPFANIFQEM